MDGNRLGHALDNVHVKFIVTNRLYYPFCSAFFLVDVIMDEVKPFVIQPIVISPDAASSEGNFSHSPL